MNLKENFNGGLTCSVNVTDIKTSMKWYKEVLGFEPIYYMENLSWCELKSPVENVSVGLSQVEQMPPPGGNAVLTWGVNDIDAARTELEKKGIKFDGDIRTYEGMVKLATFYDRDGNCFMFYQDISKPKQQ